MYFMYCTGHLEVATVYLMQFVYGHRMLKLIVLTYERNTVNFFKHDLSLYSVLSSLKSAGWLPEPKRIV